MGLNIWKCLICGWEWASRLPEQPRYCARCKRENWDKPRERLPQSKRTTMVRKRLYPIDTLEVGQSLFIDWHTLPNGHPDDRRNASISRCVLQEEYRYGKRFRREPKPRGLLVTRLA